MANKILKKFIRIFFLSLQIFQKIRKNSKIYSRRLPAELIDESFAFLPFKKCTELSISSRNYLMLDLAKYRVKKAPKNVNYLLKNGLISAQKSIKKCKLFRKLLELFKKINT